MKFTSTTAVAIAATLLFTGASVAGSHGNDNVHNRKFRGIEYTMNQVHMSLYTFDKDEAGVSNCYGQCAETWPPALLDADAELGESYSLIPRTDGTFQIAFRGKPLYTYVKDTGVGDISGDGVGGVWRLSRP